MRALIAVLLLAPCVAAAQAGAGAADLSSISATDSNAGVGVELARLQGDTKVFGSELETSGTLYGLNAQFQTGPFFRAEGRWLTGDIEHDIAGFEDTDRSNLIEGEATFGFALYDQTRLFAGVGYRYLETDISGTNLTVERKSHNLYIPAGISISGRVGDSGWVSNTTFKAGFIPWGEEDLNLNVQGVGSTSDTFSRSSGYMVGFSTELGTDLGAGLLTFEPFIRHFEQEDTDTENGIKVLDISTTEFGLRVNYRI